MEPWKVAFFDTEILTSEIISNTISCRAVCLVLRLDLCKGLVIIVQVSHPLDNQ